jgi:hypothetical protein
LVEGKKKKMAPSKLLATGEEDISPLRPLLNFFLKYGGAG